MFTDWVGANKPNIPDTCPKQTSPKHLSSPLPALQSTMNLQALVIGLLATLVSTVSATALTYKVEASERACFYTNVDQMNSKIAFYFAVFPLLQNNDTNHESRIMNLSTNKSKVQSGGSFDIDFSVVGPGEKIILEETKERQGDFVFTAQTIGEYRFCFNNEMSTFAEKLVDFEIAVRPFPFPLPSVSNPLYPVRLLMRLID